MMTRIIGRQKIQLTTHDDMYISFIFLGIFIGASFVFKKKGLIQSVERSGITMIKIAVYISITSVKTSYN